MDISELDLFVSCLVRVVEGEDGWVIAYGQPHSAWVIMDQDMECCEAMSIEDALLICEEPISFPSMQSAMAHLRFLAKIVDRHQKERSYDFVICDDERIRI